MSNPLNLDVMAMVELARRHPSELERLKAQIEDAQQQSVEPHDALPTDRFNRTLAVGSLVLTPGGERGRLIRFDRKQERAVVELEYGGLKTLLLSKIELRRGRPRKNSYAQPA
jgi:hypothetical protein